MIARMAYPQPPPGNDWWGQPAPPPGYYPAYPAYPPPRPTNSMAVVALVSALVFAPLGIVFGHIALSQIRRSGEEGHGPAVRDPHHADARRVDERVPRQEVETAPEVPDVLRQRVPPCHDRVHEVGVARVVVLRVPVQPLAETAQVGRQHQ